MRNSKHFGGVGDTRGPQTTHCGDLLYAGEAAGFQDALFGFGMRYAMMSGHLAALAVSSGQLHHYDHLWKTRIGGHIRAGQVNRFLYARGGVLAYAYLIYRICLSRNSRDWLRRFYSPSLLKSMWLPLAQRSLGTGKNAAETLVMK
jgi:flavin-dependent dehydrogenase